MEKKLTQCQHLQTDICNICFWNIPERHCDCAQNEACTDCLILNLVEVKIQKVAKIEPTLEDFFAALKKTCFACGSVTFTEMCKDCKNHFCKICFNYAKWICVFCGM